MSDVLLSGLAKQLVAAELLDEKTAQQAFQQARRDKVSFISHLVQNRLVKALTLAEMSSEQFGLPFLDLKSLNKDEQPRGLISEKLIRQHHALPLFKRGNKLYIGVSDPANHQAVTDLQFSTGLNIEAILVEDDKLTDAIEKFSTARPASSRWGTSTSTSRW
jgi:type IV pilus assembly protein PilB